MEKRHTITCIISSYKYGHLAAHCIESVLNQVCVEEKIENEKLIEIESIKTFDKVFFVDDGVGDCYHLQKLYGDKVEFVFRERNLGVVDNFNDMLSRVDTDYVFYLGADNWIEESMLDNYFLYISKNQTKPIYVTSNIILEGPQKNDIINAYKKDVHYKTVRFSYEQFGSLTDIGVWLWDRKGFHHGSCIYLTSALKKIGGFKHNGGATSDEDLYAWRKLKELPEFYTKSIPAYLHYRRHTNNYTNTQKP